MASNYGSGSEQEDDNRTVSISDPDDYNAGRRLRQIHNARERVPEVIREEGDRVAVDERDGGISRGRYREIVADALIDYLVELEPLMLDEDLDGGQEFWAEREIDVDGQEDPITLERIVEENGEIYDEHGNEVPLPIAVSRAAYRAANLFVNRIGFGLQKDRGLPRDTI